MHTVSNCQVSLVAGLITATGLRQIDVNNRFQVFILYQDAILARDKAAQEHAAASRELEHALARREREKSNSDQEISLRDLEIRQLKDLLRDSEDKLHVSKPFTQINWLSRVEQRSSSLSI